MFIVVCVEFNNNNFNKSMRLSGIHVGRVTGSNYEFLMQKSLTTHTAYGQLYHKLLGRLKNYQTQKC